MTLRILQYIDFASNVLPLYAGISRWRSLDRPMRLFLWRLILAVFAEGVSFALAKSGIHNLWWVQTFHLWDIPLLLYVFAAALEGTRAPPFLRVMIPVYVAVFVAAKFTFEPWPVMDQYTYSVANLAVLAAAVLMLIRVISEGEGDPFRAPWLWFSGGMMLYCASNLVLFSVVQWYTTLTQDEGVRIWSVHWIGDTLINVCFMMGFLRVKK